jgi:hypothetical protein
LTDVDIETLNATHRQSFASNGIGKNNSYALDLIQDAADGTLM